LRDAFASPRVPLDALRSRRSVATRRNIVIQNLLQNQNNVIRNRPTTQFNLIFIDKSVLWR